MTNKEGWGESSTKKGRVQKRKDLINEACREGPAPIATQIDIQMANLEIGTSSWFDIICSGVIPFRKISQLQHHKLTKQITNKLVNVEIGTRFQFDIYAVGFTLAQLSYGRRPKSNSGPS